MDNTKAELISDSVLETTTALATNLVQSEPFLQFKAAQEALDADPGAQRLLAELSELQQKIRNQQYEGGVSEADLGGLHELQGQVGTNETIQAYGYAQEKAVAFLREVNLEISSLIGIDFASLTRRSSGCC